MLKSTNWKCLSVVALALCLVPAVASADWRGGGGRSYQGGGGYYHGGGGGYYRGGGGFGYGIRFGGYRPRSNFGFSIGFSNYYGGGYRDAGYGSYYRRGDYYGYGYSALRYYTSDYYYCDTPRYYSRAYYYEPHCDYVPAGSTPAPTTPTTATRAIIIATATSAWRLVGPTFAPVVPRHAATAAEPRRSLPREGLSRAPLLC